MKKAVFILLTLFILISTVCFAASFTDVASDHWAHQYITGLADKKVISGYPDGTFKPSGTITRGEFIKLVISSCLPSWYDVNELEGTMNHWAAGYVRMAEEYGVIGEGYIDENNINLPITRLEMVKMVSLADVIFKENDYDFTETTDFKDTYTMDLFDLNLLRHAVNKGLVAGYPDGTFGPEKSMTRAEAATMIWRFTK